MEPNSDNGSQASLRWSVYAILMAVGIGAMVGRILAVDSIDMRRLVDAKFDKECADTKKALQGEGWTGVRLDYEIARAKTDWAVSKGYWRPFLSANDRSRWCTVRALVEPEMRVPGAPYAIDKVVDRKASPGWDTIDMVYRNGHYYSSKPPLLSTLMAAEYWVIHRVTGKTLGTHPYAIGRFMMITINGLCLLLIFIFTARLVERLGTSDWGRILVMATCVFGTLLTAFAITITNHLPAAACAAVLVDALVRIWLDGDRRPWTFILAGFFGAMLAANELPAAALSAAAGLVLLVVAPKRTLIAFLPPALLVAAAFFATNWIAVQSLKPAYLHRSGEDNWYDYPGTYWKNRSGIDQGEKSAAVYTFHALIGHHGVLSLTPVWLLSLLGAGLAVVRGNRSWRWLALLALGVTLVCMAFYIWWPTVDRNYGGNSAGFRWVFWLAPLWLVLMLPAADLMARRRWSQGVALVLLAFSALSVAYVTWNAWSPPWIMNLLGWLRWL